MTKLWRGWWLGVLTLAVVGLGFGCSGQLVTDDDDASDDDGGDDDASDDDTGDDDGGDDDGGDDDGGDDDGGDDDGGDDDTDIPPQPGFTWDIPGGPLAGSYHFDSDVYCDWYTDYPGVWASSDWQWSEMIGYTFFTEPGPGQHVTDNYFGMEIGVYDFEAYGGPDCFVDTIQGWPHVTGTFQCLGVDGWSRQGNGITVDVINGAFRCP